MTKFNVGDIIELNNVVHQHSQFKIIEVWDDTFIPRLLVTDVEQTTMKCLPVLQCDCTLVRREEFTRHSQVSKAHPILDQRIITEVKLGRD
jgi:hypothetical protein